MSVQGVRHAVGSSRSSTWTITPAIVADGRLLLTQLLLRGTGSIDAQVLSDVKEHLSIGRTEKAMQSDETFTEFCSQWGPKVGATLHKPGMVLVDGHHSHLTRQFIIECLHKKEPKGRMEVSLHSQLREVNFSVTCPSEIRAPVLQKRLYYTIEKAGKHFRKLFL